MSSCIQLTIEMLIAPILIEIPRKALTYSEARGIAAGNALSLDPEAMLLSWFDKKKGQFSPQVE